MTPELVDNGPVFALLVMYCAGCFFVRKHALQGLHLGVLSVGEGLAADAAVMYSANIAFEDEDEDEDKDTPK